MLKRLTFVYCDYCDLRGTSWIDLGLFGVEISLMTAIVEGSCSQLVYLRLENVEFSDKDAVLFCHLKRLEKLFFFRVAAPVSVCALIGHALNSTPIKMLGLLSCHKMKFEHAEAILNGVDIRWLRVKLYNADGVTSKVVFTQMFHEYSLGLCLRLNPPAYMIVTASELNLNNVHLSKEDLASSKFPDLHLANDFGVLEWEETNRSEIPYW